MSGSIGQEVTLVCTGSGGDVGLYDASWHKEILGDVPKFVTVGYSRPFSNTYYLTMTYLKPEDEASYYCSTWDSSRNAHTALQVHGELRQKPLTFASLLKPKIKGDTVRSSVLILIADSQRTDQPYVLVTSASLHVAGS